MNGLMSPTHAEKFSDFYDSRYSSASLGGICPSRKVSPVNGASADIEQTPSLYDPQKTSMMMFDAQTPMPALSPDVVVNFMDDKQAFDSTIDLGGVEEQPGECSALTTRDVHGYLP